MNARCLEHVQSTCKECIVQLHEMQDLAKQSRHSAELTRGRHSAGPCHMHETNGMLGRSGNICTEGDELGCMLTWTQDCWWRCER